MRECLFGAETEYGLAAIDTTGRGVAQSVVQNGVMRCALDTIPHLPDCHSLRYPSLFLTNGGRLYLDCGYRVEYSTPEVTTPHEVVRYCRAGDVIMERLAARLLARHTDWRELFCTRSNVDYVHRVAWGAHESYLMKGDGPPETVAEDLVPFLVTRVVFTGAGGFDASSVGLRFLLSPRAAFTSVVASANTMHHRPIFNTRDEPLAHGGYRRVHVICGESLCSDLGLLLRTGTTALVVRLVELGSRAGRELALARPLGALGAVASDPTCRRRVRLADGRRMTAVEIQRAYLGAIEASMAGPGPASQAWPDWAPRICAEWRRTLDQLERDPFALEDRLDWAGKWSIYNLHLARYGLGWSQLRRMSAVLDGLSSDVGALQGNVPWSSRLAARLASIAPEAFASACRALADWGFSERDLDRFFECRARLFELDMRWGELSDRGVFRSLDRSGALLHRMDGCDGAEAAAEDPPGRGRARLRGLHVKRLAGASQVTDPTPGSEDRRRHARCSWDVLIDHDGRRLDLGDPFETEERWAAG